MPTRKYLLYQMLKPSMLSFINLDPYNSSMSQLTAVETVNILSREHVSASDIQISTPAISGHSLVSAFFWLPSSNAYLYL